MSDFATNQAAAQELAPVAHGPHLPLVTKIALLIVLTIVLVAATLAVLPRLVVLGPWGYLMAFVVNGLSAASVVIPGPGFAVIAIMAKELNPIGLGIAAGLGATLGELTGYWLGAQGREPLRDNRVYNFVQGAMSRSGGGILLTFGLLPFLPVDAAGIIAGATRYPIRKFVLYLGVGKVITTSFTLYMVAKAFEWAEPYLKWLG